MSSTNNQHPADGLLRGNALRPSGWQAAELQRCKEMLASILQDEPPIPHWSAKVLARKRRT